jgi:rare lipoprotein A
MPRFGIRRGFAPAGFVGIGAVALVAVQQVTGAVAQPEPSPDTYHFQTLHAPAVYTAASMNAAVSTGQFEELVRPTPVPTIAPTPTAVPLPTPAPTLAPALTVFQSGIASTYGEGDGFEGNRTACGQIFRTHIVQVAHKSLPCGTMIRIEDTDSGRSVEAEVTDRGPYIPGRIVDLSWGAFSELDPTAPGLLRVNVYLLDN